MNRLFKTREAMQEFLLAEPGAYHVLVLHGSSCSESRCVCEPEYEVRDLTVDNLMEGAKLDEEWRQQTRS